MNRKILTAEHLMLMVSNLIVGSMVGSEPLKRYLGSVQLELIKNKCLTFFSVKGIHQTRLYSIILSWVVCSQERRPVFRKYRNADWLWGRLSFHFTDKIYKDDLHWLWSYDITEIIGSIRSVNVFEYGYVREQVNTSFLQARVAPYHQLENILFLVNRNRRIHWK